jgi:glycosyltransferase 2 family protein
VKPRRGRNWLALIGMLISAAIVLIGWRVVDWRETIAVFSAISLRWVVPFVALNLAGIALLVMRWRILIASVDPIPMRRAFNFLTIGLAANAVLPGRPGDVFRALLLRQAGFTSFGNGLASVALERLTDVSTMCVMGFFLLAFVPLPEPIQFALAVFSLGCILALAVLLTLRGGSGFVALAHRRLPFLRRRLMQLLLGKAEQFADALRIIHDPRRAAGAVVLTFAAWVTLTAAIFLLMKALELPVPAAAAILVIVATNLGAAIPSSPGSIGVYHLLAVLALSVWISDRSLAVAFAVAAHLLSILIHIVLGAIAALDEGIQFRLGAFDAGEK